MYVQYSAYSYIHVGQNSPGEFCQNMSNKNPNLPTLVKMEEKMNSQACVYYACQGNFGSLAKIAKFVFSVCRWVTEVQAENPFR